MRRLVTNSLAVLTAGGTARALGILVFFLLARTLGPGPMGAFAYAIALVEVLRTVIDFGMGVAATRRIAAGASVEEVVGAGLLARLLSLAVIFMAMLPLLATADGADLIWVAALALIPIAISGALAPPFYAALRMRRIAPAHVAGAFVYLILVGMGILSGWGPAGFLGAYVLQEAVTMAVILAAYRSEWGPLWRFERASLRALVVDALPLGALTVVVMLYFRLDVFMLEAMVGSRAVGEYSVAFRASEVLLLGATALSTSTLPHFSRLVSIDSPELERTFGRLFKGTVAATVPLAVLVTVMAPLALPWIFPTFRASGPALAILVWSVVFIVANVQTSDLLIAHGYGGTVLKIATMNLAANALLNLMLIPRYGVVGASAATVVTEGANAILQSFAVSRRTPLRVPWTLWGIAMPLGVLSLGALAFSPSWWIRIALIAAAVLAALGIVRGALRAPSRGTHSDSDSERSCRRSS